MRPHFLFSWEGHCCPTEAFSLCVEKKEVLPILPLNNQTQYKVQITHFAFIVIPRSWEMDLELTAAKNTQVKYSE